MFGVRPVLPSFFISSPADRVSPTTWPCFFFLQLKFCGFYSSASPCVSPMHTTSFAGYSPKMSFANFWTFFRNLGDWVRTRSVPLADSPRMNSAILTLPYPLKPPPALFPDPMRYKVLSFAHGNVLPLLGCSFPCKASVALFSFSSNEFCLISMFSVLRTLAWSLVLPRPPPLTFHSPR